MSLTAICEINGELELRKISLNPATEEDVKRIFSQQKEVFLNSREISAFDGGWLPDSDELMLANIPETLTDLLSQFEQNWITLDSVNLQEFDKEPLKALCLKDDVGDILIQRFSQNQYLDRGFSIFLDGDTFNRLTQPTISFANKLLCIIRNGQFIFASYAALRCVFPIQELFIEATKEELNTFKTLSMLQIDNQGVFDSMLNENIRKRIHSILKKNIFQRFSPAEILRKAKREKIQDLVQIENNKLKIPTDKKQILKLLSFLDDKLYRGPVTEVLFLSNSSKEA